MAVLVVVRQQPAAVRHDNVGAEHVLHVGCFVVACARTRAVFAERLDAQMEITSCGAQQSLVAPPFLLKSEPLRLDRSEVQRGSLKTHGADRWFGLKAQRGGHKAGLGRRSFGATMLPVLLLGKLDDPALKLVVLFQQRPARCMSKADLDYTSAKCLDGKHEECQRGMRKNMSHRCCILQHRFPYRTVSCKEATDSAHCSELCCCSWALYLSVSSRLMLSCSSESLPINTLLIISNMAAHCNGLVRSLNSSKTTLMVSRCCEPDNSDPLSLRRRAVSTAGLTTSIAGEKLM
eukprot:m.210683 g.210683  ORF g.210683 m.210683 type:complete len:291 (-) comp18566_c0_seq3:3239-4111(-)